MPLKELVINSEQHADGYSDLKVSVNERQDVVMEGVDGGQRIEELTGDWDYEYWVTVRAEWKETLLLHLLKERFADSTRFKAWLEQQNIPYEFHSH